MKANSDKSKQSKKATRRVLAGVLCGASVLSLVLSLVMPPISQAIANDVQTVPTEGTVTRGGSSTESTVVENTNNGDTEKQNSVENEGDEAGDDSQPEEQPEEEQKNEGTTTSDGETVVTAAENEQAKTASDEMIDSASKLKEKLGNASGTANFMLTENIDLTNDNDNNKTIQLGNDGSNITLDLNGHKIKYASNGQPLFNITGGATLTVKDGTQTAPTETPVNQEKMNGNLASMECDDSNIPNKLIYYVTESVAKGTGATEVPGTTETLKEYKVDIKGAIVACGDHANLKLVNLYKTGGKVGTFNLESGAITQQQNSRDQNNSVNNRVSSLVYAEEDSTVNMSGGYVCGATSMGHGAGIELGIKNGKGATLNLAGGVIAGNYAPEGGGVYADGSTINMTGDTTGGTISGNGTFEDQPGYGAGICAKDSMVTITNGYITNNKYQFYVDEGHKGNGCHGGGGIAAFSKDFGQRKGSLVISGGYITGNYSAEAGGGVYAGAWNRALSGFTFSGGIIASNVAQYSEGGGIRIAAPTVGDFNVSGKKAYITNNTTNTTNDWGGGGVFVQGGADGVQSASLKIYNALITNNHANGFGGGFAACPTGETAITDTNGIAIFGNSDGKPDGSGYNRSGGTHGKNDDADWRPNNEGGEITEDFKKAGHQDLFLIRDSANAESLPYIAAVTGQMLGGGAANWSGTIDGQPKTIGKYDGAQAKCMIGLRSGSSVDDQNVAIGLASLYITGNKSNVHGGGIMTNGDVVAGSTAQVSVYPKMKLTGSKALTGRDLKKNEFKFELLKQGSNLQAPSFNDKGALQPNGCRVVDTAQNDTNGSFTFDLGEVYADTNLVYYLVEKPGAEKDITYSKTIYKIEPTVTEDTSKSHDVLDIHYTYYRVDSVKITKTENGIASESTVNGTSNNDVVSIQLTNDTTFTNEYTPYTSSGSWTPKATKVVEGGEMKEFTLEFADNAKFEGNSLKTVTTSATGKNPQTLIFDSISYDLSKLEGGDTTKRGASNTFTYYVREKNDSSIFSHYKFDQSVYKFTVVATDNTNKTIDCMVTYRKGTVDSNGAWVSADNADHELTDTSTPTFTNTYSTSLPLSGMSGVTLTYLAGAAVLCAAAAWMHIRRKANAKGGERRE